MTKEKFEKVQLIRSQRDPSGLFHEWHSKPEYGLSEVQVFMETHSHIEAHRKKFFKKKTMCDYVSMHLIINDLIAEIFGVQQD